MPDQYAYKYHCCFQYHHKLLTSKLLSVNAYSLQMQTGFYNTFSITLQMVALFQCNVAYSFVFVTRSKMFQMLRFVKVLQGFTISTNPLVCPDEIRTNKNMEISTKLHQDIVLHAILGSPSVYREWVKCRLTDIDAVENEDFQAAEISTPSGQTKKDYKFGCD